MNEKKGEQEISSPEEKMREVKMVEEDIEQFEQTECGHFPDRLISEAESLRKLIPEKEFLFEDIRTLREKLKDIKGGIESMITRINSYEKARVEKQKMV